MISSKQSSPSMLNTSASSNSLVQKSNRKFLVFCAFLLTLLLGASLQRASSCLPTYDPRAYQKAFIGKRFLSTGAVSRVRSREVVHEVRRAEQGTISREEALYCDRSHHRTDVCVAKGDVRVLRGADAGSYQVLVFAEQGHERVEELKPYTRKWEESVMKTIDEVKVIKKVLLNRSSSAHRTQRAYETRINTRLQRRKGMARFNKSAAERRRNSRAANYDSPSPACDVRHEVPAILFSTGGYTGNVYHEFNDGLIPLFITAQKYRPPGQVVLIVLEYHNWWMSKYAEVVAQISNYTVIDLARDKRVHCFPEVTAGLRVHDELAIDEENCDHASIQGFQSMLSAAYARRGYNKGKMRAEKRRKLVLISRSSPRALLNEEEVIGLAEEIGFSVHVLKPAPWTRMADIYKVVSRCDVMVGVHGAAMTHLLFMRPGATFIQVVPLGTDWAAATYYGEPAQKLGLNYVAYKVSPTESSLSQKYASDDPVLVSPESVNQKGWWETKRIYLEAQDVTVSLPRMRETLLSAYAHAAL